MIDSLSNQHPAMAGFPEAALNRKIEPLEIKIYAAAIASSMS
ncbi:hypothetical protein [Achromobacter sp.]|nr:hypothetical protein [Achromobacter sp.]